MQKHALIINNEFPPIGAGAGNASYYFAKNLAEMGCKVTVVTSNFQGLPLAEEKEGVAVIRVRCPRKKRFESNVWEFLSFARSASTYLKNQLCHKRASYTTSICFHSIPSGIVSYKLFKKFQIPYIVMLRGGDVPGFLPEKLRYYHALTMPLTKGIWKNASYIFANSNGLKELAQETAGKVGKKIGVLRNGVDTSFFRPHREKFFEGELKMAFTGRLYKQKGLDHLIDAITVLPEEEKSRVKLEIIGEGPEMGKLLKKTAERNLHNIKFLGYLTKEEISLRFNESNLFVLPSLYEGMSNSLLEAMAAGLPVLVTDIMGNKELITNGENGLLVPPKDPEALSDAIIKLLKEPQQLAAFSKNNLSKIAEYDWISSAEQLYNMISAFSSKPRADLFISEKM